MLNEARRFEHLLRLEDAFTVVYWDQRGCGRSLRGANGHSNLSVERMASDAVAILDLLQKRFGRKTCVTGFSLGATIGAYAAAKRPDLVSTLLAVGTDIDGPGAGTGAYEFALKTARERDNQKAIAQLMAIGPPPHLSSSQFSTRVRWATNFGGVSRHQTYNTLVRGLLASLVWSSDYSIADIIRTVRGIGTTQAAMLPELADLDLVKLLPRLGVPVVMVQGRLDQVAPGSAAQRYVDTLEAPTKELVWFETSAHTPHLDEPGKFRDLLMRVRGTQRASA
jgi:pimeloyl-ACP methyl ester carboxylesterase